MSFDDLHEALRGAEGPRGKRKTSRDVANAVRTEISDKWSDFTDVLTVSIDLFPKELIRLVGDFARSTCIYWPSITNSHHIKVWRLDLDRPENVPQLVHFQYRPIHGAIDVNHCSVPSGVNGGFYLYYSRSLSYTIFKFNADKHELTTVVPLTTDPDFQPDDKHRLVAVESDSAPTVFYLFITSWQGETLIRPIYTDNKQSGERAVDRVWIHPPFLLDYYVPSASYGGSVVVVGGGSLGNLCAFYHSSKQEWFTLPPLPVDHRLPLLAHRTIAVVNNRIIVFGGYIRYTWAPSTMYYVLSADLDHIAMSEDLTAITWTSFESKVLHQVGSDVVHHRRVNAIGSFHYLTESSIVVCPTDSHYFLNLDRVNSKPPRPKIAARLDTSLSWHLVQ
jgi:hypothetical protein